MNLLSCLVGLDLVLVALEIVLAHLEVHLAIPFEKQKQRMLKAIITPLH